MMRGLAGFSRYNIIDDKLKVVRIRLERREGKRQSVPPGVNDKVMMISFRLSP